MPNKVSAEIDTTPFWSAVKTPKLERLDHNQHVDAVVVGGGITGLTAGYLLATSGKSVIVLERNRIGDIDTGHTTAHVTYVTDTTLTELVSRHGRQHAQAVWDAELAAMVQIESIVRAAAIDCGFDWVDGYLHQTRDATTGHVVDLGQEATLAGELGFDAEFVQAVPFFGVPGVRFGSQARVHPRRYLAGLVGGIQKAGGEVYERSEASDFCPNPLSVTVDGHILTCDDIIVATHDPIVGVSSMTNATLLQTKLALYSSYVVAGRVPCGRIPDALFWDTSDPYHYLRINPGETHDVVIYGGEDHKTGQVSDTSACYERLTEGLQALVPGIEITHRWSGQVIETPDGLPYIGPTADHQYAATGFSGNGMTFGTLAAIMMSDAILGRRNPWVDLFAIDRAALRHGLWDYLKENADYPYYQLRDRFAGVEGRSLRAVRRGQGKIIDWNGKTVAAYRDEHGATTIRSATCTHMGCLVAWNGAERTWDCPCHGSRFKPNGDVISGPAETPLPEE
jgi:glycine/D-amino acid oxidase-like deaminating enzyme/nitrite reductase/ring-hydroxylating ferredoxin subunit